MVGGLGPGVSRTPRGSARPRGPVTSVPVFLGRPWAADREPWDSSPGTEPLQVPAGVKEDSFNVLDLAEYTKNQPWWRKVFAPSSGSSAEKYSVATQLVIGGVTGW